jgi:hypothetical protein
VILHAVAVGRSRQTFRIRIVELLRLVPGHELEGLPESRSSIGSAVMAGEVRFIRDIGKRPGPPPPLGSPSSVFLSTPNDVDTYQLQFLLNSAREYACPVVGQ